MTIINNEGKDKIDAWNYFPSTVYTSLRPEFLDTTKKVCEDWLKKSETLNIEIDELYPCRMTESLLNDNRLSDFCRYVGESCWNILDSQGYDMSQLDVVFTEMWCQEHHKYSLMEQHTHGYGAQLVGFYFVDCPEDSSKVIFYDPRPSKVQINLYEKDKNEVTNASNAINFDSSPGLLMFTNSWLPHSFTKNPSEKPFRFIHFNVSVQPKQVFCQSPAEVI